MVQTRIVQSRGEFLAVCENLRSSGRLGGDESGNQTKWGKGKKRRWRKEEKEQTPWIIDIEWSSFLHEEAVFFENEKPSWKTANRTFETRIFVSIVNEKKLYNGIWIKSNLLYRSANMIIQILWRKKYMCVCMCDKIHISIFIHMLHTHMCIYNI